MLPYKPPRYSLHSHCGGLLMAFAPLLVETKAILKELVAILITIRELNVVHKVETLCTHEVVKTSNHYC